MTRKFVALLLVLMLLPVAALAETFCLELSIEMDAENATELFTSMELFAASTDPQGMSEAFVELMDGMMLRIVTQDDASRFVWAFDETNLLEMTLLTGGEDIVILSELMPGMGFTIPKALFDTQDDAFIRLMEDTDWMTLLSGMFTAAMEQAQGVSVTTQRGSFSGDAYTGGVYCTTITLDDAAIASMLNALLTEDVRALVLVVADYWGFDGAGFINSVEQANATAAQGNAHRYVLRLVYDGSNRLIGLSAVVLQGENQLGTLSVGLDEGEVRIVAGFGLDDVNYWHAQAIELHVTEGEAGLTTFGLKGGIEEFTAPKDEDFSYAAATRNESLYACAWSAEVNLQNGNATWKYTVSQCMQDSAITSMSGQGLYIAGKRMSNACTYAIDGRDYMTERVVWAPCAAIEATTEGVTLCELGGNDTELITEMGVTVGNELANRLLKVIPMKLLLFLQ